MFSTHDLIVILGPTASGKTALAVDLAQVLDAEIISADSRQVYRNMDIGTGKDLEEYQGVPYHLINIKEAGEKYNVADFQKDFWACYQSIKARKKIVILCGGTGLYIDAVLRNHTHMQVPENTELRETLKGLDHATLLSMAQQQQLPEHPDLSTHKRTIRALEIAAYLKFSKLEASPYPSLEALVIGLDPPLEYRRENIAKRLEYRLSNGLIEEVKLLLQKGVNSEDLIYYGLEYKYVTQSILEDWPKEVLAEKLCVAIQQYAKRQMTYFRSMERKGLKINWIHF